MTGDRDVEKTGDEKVGDDDPDEGEKRARAAKKYLQDLGIQVSQLQITSYGETRPFCKQQNEECYQQNRRAHFVAK